MALPPNPDKTADEVEAVGCQVWCQRLVLKSIDNVATREQLWTRHVTLRPRPGLFLPTWRHWRRPRRSCPWSRARRRWWRWETRPAAQWTAGMCTPSALSRYMNATDKHDVIHKTGSTWRSSQLRQRRTEQWSQVKYAKNLLKIRQVLEISLWTDGQTRSSQFLRSPMGADVHAAVDVG